MEREEEWGIKWANIPHRRPIRCPPIILLGFAVLLRGIAKTIKVVAPMDAIITAGRSFRKRSSIKIVRVARKLCKR